MFPKQDSRRSFYADIARHQTLFSPSPIQFIKPPPGICIGVWKHGKEVLEAYGSNQHGNLRPGLMALAFPCLT
jgi:hypothetical protein